MALTWTKLSRNQKKKLELANAKYNVQRIEGVCVSTVNVSPPKEALATQFDKRTNRPNSHCKSKQSSKLTAIYAKHL